MTFCIAVQLGAIIKHYEKCSMRDISVRSVFTSGFAGGMLAGLSELYSVDQHSYVEVYRTNRP